MFSWLVRLRDCPTTASGGYRRTAARHGGRLYGLRSEFQDRRTSGKAFGTIQSVMDWTTINPIRGTTMIGKLLIAAGFGAMLSVAPALAQDNQQQGMSSEQTQSDQLYKKKKS